jgi:hypothetical protein
MCSDSLEMALWEIHPRLYAYIYIYICKHMYLTVHRCLYNYIDLHICVLKNVFRQSWDGTMNDSSSYICIFTYMGLSICIWIYADACMVI